MMSMFLFHSPFPTILVHSHIKSIQLLLVMALHVTVAQSSISVLIYLDKHINKHFLDLVGKKQQIHVKGLN